MHIRDRLARRALNMGKHASDFHRAAQIHVEYHRNLSHYYRYCLESDELGVGANSLPTYPF